jgi:protein AATF/BFR2
LFSRKSKLRKPTDIELGREYSGSRVSRDALYGDESDDDPFRSRRSGDDSQSSDEDGEHDGDVGSESSENLDESDAGTDETDTDMRDSEDQSDIESDDGSGPEDFENDDEPAESRKKGSDKPLSNEREELRRLMASDHKAVATSLSEAAKADAAKGHAVKRQRVAFDALVNSRIRLQKGLAAANSIHTSGRDGVDINGASVNAAEAAALALWSTLNDLRHALADAQAAQVSSTSKKRKRIPTPTWETPSSDIWAHMREFEAESFTQRRAILDKWSRKTRGSKGVQAASRGRLLNTGTDQQSITAILDANVAAEIDSQQGKAITTQQAQPDGEPNSNSGIPSPVYDDTSFYHTLLRDLVEQRMSSTNGGIADNLHVQLPAQLSLSPITGMRKDKVKRAVDTKASKGRKMRYTVQEKIQNFMAPENRGAWGDRAREEFFASLLGKSASGMLGEEDEEMRAEDADEDLEEGGLRLFRS